ncbi:MAG: DNA polymerase II large subunit [Thermoplasmata archaeon]|nr:MAG: DNA polymerase II large subunit [Thermoplasmata archaeon]
MHEYFDQLQSQLQKCYDIADKARSRGFDPGLTVEIPQALDLAARVEQLVGPKDIAPKIRSALKKIGDRELVSIEIARQIVDGKTYRFDRIEDALDQAIRTGLAILTEGVLVAPLEGIADVRLGRNKDGSNYVDLYFSGPIRSAGGTGQAMSVLIADVVRRDLGIGRYIPTHGEIERYKEEIPLYKRVQHLQYLPSAEEIERVTSSCPICINGEGTEEEEVTGYRDLPRVETNRLRGGACLVIAEGLCLKAPKIYKHVKKLRLKGWEFLESFISKGTDTSKKGNGIPPILPSSKYIGEVIAGRPVFSHPSRKGGFRLRYGRARTGGLAATAINPATMYILNSFITVGTQIKTERPGKGTIATPCDQIEGPIVLLQNGDLVQIDDTEDAEQIIHDIKKIIDLGEILIPFGEFTENNALLPDSSYVYEWWIQELQKSFSILPKKYTFDTVREADERIQKKINAELRREINLQHPSPKDAFEMSEKYNIPLHPRYNLFWHDITHDNLITLSRYIREHGRIVLDEKENIKLILPNNSDIKKILIELGALHRQRKGNLILDQYSYPLIRCCGLDVKDNEIIETDRYKLLEHLDTEDIDNVVHIVSQLSGILIRPRAPFRIGARMGRPEKASPRKMRPPPHVLFPLGNYGGSQRLLNTAAEKGEIEVEAGCRKCPKCKKITHKIFCSHCNIHTEPLNGRIKPFKINLAEELRIAKNNIKERKLPDTIKGVIGTISKNKTPEPLEKGILRAKHNVSVFKDGTIRFDMTDAPLTHFKPKEINVSVKRLREMGYTKDYLGNNLTSDDQICELRVQDVIISKACGEYFVQVSKFIDDLLSKFYKLDRFYNIKKIDDLTGHLVIGLSPHTSAGALARIIGFTNAQVCFAHPFYHAAKRRNADGDEDGLMLLLDALLNFSHAYIPDKRGGRMDLPLILTTRIDPAEVDKEAHNIDTLARYPIEFYEATLRHENPKNVESIMGLVSSRLGSKLQYEQFGFTHDTDDISKGPKESLYKTLKTMMDKMNVQLNLAAKIRAVDEADVAYKVIERHFLPDILGNLRAFSKQSVRCPLCNTTYRRIPLQGTCIKCGGKLTLTVHEMSVKKYLDISKEIAEKYNLPQYEYQRIRLVEKSINSLFTSDKVKMTKLSDFL